MHFFNKFYEVKGLKVSESTSMSSTVGFWAVFALLLLALAASWATASAVEDTAEDLIDMGLELYQNRSYQEALKAYDQALFLSPDDVRAWMGKGKVFSALGDYNQSILAYQNATRISPDDPEAWFGVGAEPIPFAGPQRFPEGLG